MNLEVAVDMAGAGEIKNRGEGAKSLKGVKGQWILKVMFLKMQGARQRDKNEEAAAD